MGLLEYRAGMRLELVALNTRQETGANAFYSLIQAAMRQADTNNLHKLSVAFPEARRELVIWRQIAPTNMKE